MSSYGSTYIGTGQQMQVAQLQRQLLQSQQQTQKPVPVPATKGRWMDELRSYIKEHRDILFTVALVLLLDHLFFEGAMRDRLKGLMGGMISKAEGTLGLPGADKS